MMHRHVHRFGWLGLAALVSFSACGGDEGGDDDGGGAGAGHAGTGGGSGGSGGAGGSTAGSAQGGKAGKGGGANAGSGGREAGGEAGEEGSGGSAGSAAGGRAGTGGGGGTGAASGAAGSGGTSGSGGAPAEPAPGFREAAPLAEGVNVLDDPKLVVNRAGDAIVAWVGYAETHEGVWAIRYDAEAAAWSEPLRIDTEQSNASLEDVAIDEAGNAYLVWAQGFVFVTRYDAAAGEWADEFQIEDHDEGSTGSARLATGPAGTASIVWRQSDGSRSSVRNRRYDPETDEWSFWEAIDDADLRNSDQCAIAVNADGTAIAAFSQSADSGIEGSSLVANFFDAEAGLWGEAVTLLAESGESTPVWMSAAAAPNGNFFLIWGQYPSEAGEDTSLFVRRYVPGDGWDEAVPLEEQAAFTTTAPHIALDDAGNAAVVWTADDGLWSVSYDAGSSDWSEPVRLDDLSGWVAKWSSVALDAEGNALAVSAQFPVQDINVDVDAVVNRRDAGATAWGAAELLENHEYAAFGPVVGLDGDGNGFVVWRRETEADLWFSRYERD